MSKNNILIIDDEASNINIIINLLKDTYNIKVATDGNSGINILKKCSIDLILLDILMPKMNGYEVAKEIKSNPKLLKIPLIFLTVKNDPDSIESGFKHGAVDYISKPFIAVELKARVKNHINTYKLQSSLSKQVEKSITQIREKDSILFQQSKMATVGEMIGNIAHQWRQPLNTLSIALNIINMEYENNNLNDEIMTKNYNKSLKMIEHMNQIVNDFRNFFKPNKEKQMFSIHELINETIVFIEDSYKNNFIKLECDIKENINLTCYKNEIIQVLLIVLNNSKDALKINNIEEPKVKIEVINKKKNIEISIIDNGGGIKKDVINKIFDPYFTTKAEDNGTGIGLYMAKLIVEESLQGELIIQNYNNGLKTTIEFKKDIDS